MEGWLAGSVKAILVIVVVVVADELTMLAYMPLLRG
jgi:hypothetical protein